MPARDLHQHRKIGAQRAFWPRVCVIISQWVRARRAARMDRVRNFRITTMPLAITLAVFFIRASIMRRGLVKNLYQTMRMEVSEQLLQVAAASIGLDIVGLEVAGNLVLGGDYKRSRRDWLFHHYPRAKET